MSFIGAILLGFIALICAVLSGAVGEKWENAAEPKKSKLLGQTGEMFVAAFALGFAAICLAKWG